MNADRIQQLKFTAPLALAIASLPFSITLCHIALIIFAIVWLIEGKWKEKKEALLKNKIAFIFVFFFLLHVIGVVYSTEKHIAWFNLEKKISLLALPVMLASIQLKKEDARRLLLVFIITCIAGTVICLWVATEKSYQASTALNFASYDKTSFYSIPSKVSNVWMFFSYTDLAAGIGMHPSYFSLYLAFCVFLLVHFYTESDVNLTMAEKTILWILLIYVSIFILLLSSRIMIFAFFIVSLYGLNKLLKSLSRSQYWITSIVYLIFFSGFLYLNPVSRFRGYQEIVTTYPYVKPGLQKESTTIRASLWSMSIKSLSEINWLIGVGTGDVEQLITETSNKANITNVLGTHDPHNQYMQTLLGLGVLGLCTLIICFTWPAYTSFQNGNLLYLGFIFLFIVLCMTESAMELQKGIVFYSLFGSLSLFQFQPVQSVSLQATKV